MQIKGFSREILMAFAFTLSNKMELILPFHIAKEMEVSDFVTLRDRSVFDAENMI